MNALIKAAAAAAAVAVLVFVVSTSGPKYGPPPPVYPIPAYSQAVNKAAAACGAAVGPQAPKAWAEAGGIRLRSVGFALPSSDRAFPPGPGADMIANNCQSCHSAGMILTQPLLTRAEWTGELTKMMRVYKAPISEADAAQIVAYLVGLNVAP